MSVWVVCPSARPVEHVRKWTSAWHQRGYKVGIFRDEGDVGPSEADLIIVGRYRGYAIEVNDLVEHLIMMDENAEWFIIAGDDVYPDANHIAEEIAGQCNEFFQQRHIENKFPIYRYQDSKAYPAIAHTFGVMQPTGDRWADRQGPMSERVAGSAWCGREFCKRVNRGNGPLWPEYYHMCVDEELQEVATRLGIFWQRPDIIHLHQHYMRSGDSVVAGTVPAHLEKANKDFMNARRKFATRKANGFPGSECL